MAYNLESLVQILEQILHPAPHHQPPPGILDPNKKSQIETLLENVRSLKSSFENSSSVEASDSLSNLEGLIRAAAYDAEDILESHLMNKKFSGREGKRFMMSLGNLWGLNNRLDYVKKQMTVRRRIADSSSQVVSSRQDPYPYPKNNVVGISEDVKKLKDRLIREESKPLEVIPIVGMGGIGKTTLARHLYDDPSILSHFDTRAWTFFSENYNVRKILLRLLGCVSGKVKDEMFKKKDDELGLLLHKHLKDRRYLIVLDDIWSMKAWEDTRRYFPDDNNGSWIIVTTRVPSVAIGKEGSRHKMKLLVPDESWKLLHQKVFPPSETCPPELEQVGRKIAQKCSGLPLAIHVIGGLLSQAERTEAFWKQVAKDVSSIVADKKQFSNILSLSYNHLPGHLKPCLLYMAAFPEDYDIRASRLIKLWVAEGFLRPIFGKSLEEAAETYLKALVDRNLIFVHQQETKGNVESYNMHDLLRDLCMRKAREEEFLFVNEWESNDHLRRVCAHWYYSIKDAHRSANQMLLTRSFLFIGAVSPNILSDVISAFRLLRVLDILEVKFHQFPEEILQLITLRYLALSSAKTLPSSISTLCNLQTLIVRAIRSESWPRQVTPEILGMTQLRHIKFKGTYVWYHDKNRNLFVVQKNLQSLSTIAISQLSDRVLETTPNLKALGIICDRRLSLVRDLTILDKLENLKCSSTDMSCTRNFLSHLIFPSSLKKLTVSGCIILDEYMHKIGELPNLEVLKLQKDHFRSSRWEPTEEEFFQLRYLLLEDLNLVKWLADDTHFPCLKYLVIRDCAHLEEIPLDIGQIETLEIIEVHGSSPQAVASAREIQEAGRDYGLQVRFGPSSQ